MKLIENIGIFLLSVWIVIVNALQLFDLRVPNWQMLYAVILLLTGIFLLFRLNDPKAYVNVGLLLLAFSLMINSMLFLLNTNFPASSLVLAFLSALAGVFLVPIILEEKSFYNLGLFLTGLWLVLSNVLPILGVTVPWVGFAVIVVGMLAALFLLMGM